MKKIIAFAVNRPVSTCMFLLAVLCFGILTAVLIPVEFLPEISLPELLVTASYQGLPAAEMREMITIPLEDSLSSLRNLKAIKAVTRDSLTIVKLIFEWNSDMTLSAARAREIIDSTYALLPADARKPLVLPIAHGEKPLITLGIFPKNGELALARNLAAKEIKSAFSRLPGVGLINVLGGYHQEIQIEFDASKLASRNITLQQISDVLVRTNINIPAGSISQGNLDYIIKTEGRVSSLQQLGETIIPASVPFALESIASISLKDKEQTSLFGFNGQEGIGLLINWQAGKSPVSAAKSVREEIIHLQESYGKDLNFVLIHDSSEEINDAILNVALAAALGAYAAFCVLLVFSGKARAAFIVILSIPLSIAITLCCLYLCGSSLNIISLSGLALGIGMLVDNSVVVINNLQSSRKHKGIISKRVIVKATHQVARATFGSTLSSIIVFIPVLFIPGIIGELFSDLVLAVLFSLSASFFLSITYVPLFYSFKQPQKNGTISWYEKRYRTILSMIFRKPYILLLVLFLLFTISILVFPNLEKELFQNIPNGRIVITATLPPGTAITRIKQSMQAISGSLLSMPEVRSVSCYAGGEEFDPYFLADPANGKNIIHFFVILHQDNSDNSTEVVSVLQNKLRLQDAELQFSIPDEIITPLVGTNSHETQVSITAESQQDVSLKALNFRESSNHLFNNITILPSGEKAQIQLTPDREKIARAGISVRDIAAIVKSNVFGSYVSSISLHGEELNIRTRLIEAARDSLDSLRTLPLTVSENFTLFLQDLVDISISYEKPLILRENRKDIAIISCSVPLVTDAHDQLEYLADQDDSISIKNNSVFKEYANELILTFSLAVLLLYLVLGAQFQSFLLPFLMLLSLPFSMAGMLAALLVGGSSLNLNSILGLLVLSGITVNNSIVLYEVSYHLLLNYLHNKKPEISNLRQIALLAVLRGSVSRVKPILMTMLTTITAMVPLTMSVLGAQTQSSMALAIIGGLLSSTLVNLLVMPWLLYHNFRKLKPS